MTGVGGGQAHGRRGAPLHVGTFCAATVTNDDVRVSNAGFLAVHMSTNHAAVQVHTSH